jgi:hypothetical protein
MVRNTEYSNDKCGYVYHCGYDIFNNHVFRRKVFKTGETIHDYNIDEINSFQNTITNYLVENEGWIGFPNKTRFSRMFN